MGTAGKYFNLQKYLEKQEELQVRLTLQEIERIINEPLPRSAYKNADWWVNEAQPQVKSRHAQLNERQPQMNAWLDAGWKVGQVKLGRLTIFVKDIKTEAEKREVHIGKRYLHFKGKEYLTLYVAKHSDTLEDLVVYQALYGEKGIWVRPMSRFLEQVEVKGETVNRFAEIE